MKDNSESIASIRYLQGFVDGIGCIANMLVTLLKIMQDEQDHDKNVLQTATLVQTVAEILKNTNNRLDKEIDKLAKNNNIKLEDDEVLIIDEETMEIKKEKNNNI